MRTSYVMLPVFKCVSIFINAKFDSQESKVYIFSDSNKSLAAFPLFIALLYMGKAAKLKLFISIRESIHFAFLRIKFEWYL